MFFFSAEKTTHDRHDFIHFNFGQIILKIFDIILSKVYQIIHSINIILSENLILDVNLIV